MKVTKTQPRGMIDIDYAVLFTVAIVNPPFDTINNEPSYDRLEDLVTRHAGAEGSSSVDLPERLVFTFQCPLNAVKESVEVTEVILQEIVGNYIPSRMNNESN